ncbi:MAG: hypothetical protein AB7F99_01145 [Vicinamibacterales bacterium]
MPARKNPRVRAVRASARKPVPASAKGTVRVRERIRLSPVENARLDRIAENHAARLAAEFAHLEGLAQDLAGAASGIAGGKGTRPGALRTGGLRDSMTGASERYRMPHADLLDGLPGNTDATAAGNAGPSERGGARGDASAFRPSGNPAAWMAGAASTDATVTKDPSTGIVEKAWTVENGDGSTTQRTSVFNPQDGSTTSTSRTTSAGGGETNYIRITDHANGTSDGTTRMSDQDGTTTHEWARDTKGRLVTDLFTTTDSRGRVVEEWDRRLRPPQGINRMPTGEETSELARRLGARFSHGAKAPVVNPTKVNPGDRDDSPPPAPRLNPGDGIVVNPAGPGVQSREVSAARAKHWRQQMRDKVGGIVNPGSGGGRK